MKILLLGLGKFIFQISVIVFIVGYCFGFWFNRKKEKATKLANAQKKVMPKAAEHKVAFWV